MAIPQTRAQLIDWCLRELGAPVLQINIDEDQLEDRIDEGLAYFRDYHFDGVEHAYVPHKITASRLTFASASLAPFMPGEPLVGLTSGATAVMLDKAADNLSMRFRYAVPRKAEFQNGETVKGLNSGQTVVLAASNAVFIGDLDNEFITIPDKVISIFNLITLNASPATSSGMFDVRYQFALNDMYNLLQTDLISYTMFKQNLSLYQFLFNGEKNIHYNRKTERLYLDIDWQKGIQPDQYVLVEGWVVVEPEAFPKVYGDLFVRKYCTALIKRQWGANLKKFSGIALPGNVTLNGQQIYDEANEEIEKLEKRIEREWQLPPTFMVG